MKSVMLTGLRSLEILERPKPRIQNENDVLLKINVVGVCGSDVHYYRTGRIGDQVVEYPYAVGHECSATVVEIGKNVDRLRVGDRVAVDPAVSCFTCDQCLSGRHHTCRRLKFLGCPGQMEGCMSEFLVMPQETCFKIPPKMTHVQSALVEPLSIGMYAVDFLKHAHAECIAILGNGPIGMCVLLSAKAAGIEHIFVTDKIDRRIEIARSAGARLAANPNKMDILEAMKEIVPGGLDAVFECCGEPDALDQAVDLLKPGGKLIIVGIPEPDRISFDISALRRKELSIQNVRRQNNFVRPAIEAISNGAIDVDFLVTHHFSFEETARAFDLVDGYREGVMKAMIHIS